MSADAFKANLLHIKNNVLPQSWQLAAVQKWNAYGNGISTLAGTAAQLQLPVCVLTNAEARGVVAAAKAAGSKPEIWRIMPADGPAKYPEIFAAATAGLGIQVGTVPGPSSCHAVTYYVSCIVNARVPLHAVRCRCIMHDAVRRIHPKKHQAAVMVSSLGWVAVTCSHCCCCCCHPRKP